MSHGSTGAGGRSKGLVLTAMIFAVAMTFIDQTIVAIAAPTIQHARQRSRPASWPARNPPRNCHAIGQP